MATKLMTATMRRALRPAAAAMTGSSAAHMSSTTRSSLSPSVAAFRARREQQQPLHRLFSAVAVAVTAVATISVTGTLSEPQRPEVGAKSGHLPGGYSENPIQNVTALLRLYDEIDQNMAVLAGRMLEELERKVAAEKAASADGETLKLSPEQRALNMSIDFEATLEKVQDAVFRNNYVTKAQVADAMARLVRGELRGGGAGGKLSVAEAEALDEYVRKLGRLRWLCTGSREPLIPTHSAQVMRFVPIVSTIMWH